MESLVDLSSTASRDILAEEITTLKALLRLNADGIGDEEHLLRQLTQTRAAIDQFEHVLIRRHELLASSVTATPASTTRTTAGTKDSLPPATPPAAVEPSVQQTKVPTSPTSSIESCSPRLSVDSFPSWRSSRTSQMSLQRDASDSASTIMGQKSTHNLGDRLATDGWKRESMGADNANDDDNDADAEVDRVSMRSRQSLRHSLHSRRSRHSLRTRRSLYEGLANQDGNDGDDYTNEKDQIDLLVDEPEEIEYSDDDVGGLFSEEDDGNDSAEHYDNDVQDAAFKRLSQLLASLQAQAEAAVSAPSTPMKDIDPPLQSPRRRTPLSPLSAGLLAAYDRSNSYSNAGGVLGDKLPQSPLARNVFRRALSLPYSPSSRASSRPASPDVAVFANAPMQTHASLSAVLAADMADERREQQVDEEQEPQEMAGQENTYNRYEATDAIFAPQPQHPPPLLPAIATTPTPAARTSTSTPSVQAPTPSVTPQLPPTQPAHATQPQPPPRPMRRPTHLLHRRATSAHSCPSSRRTSFYGTTANLNPEKPSRSNSATRRPSATLELEGLLVDLFEAAYATAARAHLVGGGGTAGGDTDAAAAQVWMARTWGALVVVCVAWWIVGAVVGWGGAGGAGAACVCPALAASTTQRSVCLAG